MNSILIFIGAGLGGVIRYWMSNVVYTIVSRGFPYGTLFVNVSGSFMMGIFYTLLLDRFTVSAPYLRSLLLIGVLGGYTTFSSFSIETVQLVESGEWFKVFINIFVSVASCLFATWIGIIGARQI